uniref:SLC26A/SulP transporter domain-containing protein n=2 Tax=Aegilops tauschii subsp. strangulata TaxID=200361 RepID=A0A453IRF8_AEGTS
FSYRPSFMESSSSTAAVETAVTVPPPSTFDVSRRPDTAGLVLNSPRPPSLREELVGVVGKAFRPHGSGHGGDRRPPRWAWVLAALQAVFPVLQWGRTYTLKSFRSDVMAGLTLASLGIPQSIGYANLAKLDPQYGLYTSVVPPLIYAVMGTSREIAIGPVAVVSLLLSSMVQKVVDPAVDPVTYRTLVFTVTFLAGVFQVSFGLFRLGFLVDFLSHAAIVGFMGGAAIVIGLQQLKGLLGLSRFTNSTDVVAVAKAVFSALHDPVMAPRQLLHRLLLPHIHPRHAIHREEVQEALLAVGDLAAAVGHPVYGRRLRHQGRQARRQDHPRGARRPQPELRQAHPAQRPLHHRVRQDRRHLRRHRAHGSHCRGAIFRHDQRVQARREQGDDRHGLLQRRRISILLLRRNRLLLQDRRQLQRRRQVDGLQHRHGRHGVHRPGVLHEAPLLHAHGGAGLHHPLGAPRADRHPRGVQHLEGRQDGLPHMPRRVPRRALRVRRDRPRSRACHIVCEDHHPVTPASGGGSGQATRNKHLLQRQAVPRGVPDTGRAGHTHRYVLPLLHQCNFHQREDHGMGKGRSGHIQ